VRMWAVCRGDCWRCLPRATLPGWLGLSVSARLRIDGWSPRSGLSTQRREGPREGPGPADRSTPVAWRRRILSCRIRSTGSFGGCTQPSMGRRHHVRLDHRGLDRSGGGLDLSAASSHEVGDREPPDSGVGDGCAHQAVTHRRPVGASYEPWSPARRHPISWVLAGYGLTASRSRRGNCGDNAVVERFFHTRETEHV